MKPAPFTLAFAIAALSCTLAGCGGHPRWNGSGRFAMGGMMGDHNAMCELYRRMQAAPTAEERQAMMDRYMAGMAPETRRQRLRMMREQCK